MCSLSWENISIYFAQSNPDEYFILVQMLKKYAKNAVSLN